MHRAVPPRSRIPRLWRLNARVPRPYPVLVPQRAAVPAAVPTRLLLRPQCHTSAPAPPLGRPRRWSSASPSSPRQLMNPSPPDLPPLFSRIAPTAAPAAPAAPTASATPSAPTAPAAPTASATPAASATSAASAIKSRHGAANSQLPLAPSRWAACPLMLGRRRAAARRHACRGVARSFRPAGSTFVAAEAGRAPRRSACWTDRRERCRRWPPP